jgi:hypothetical protein
MLIWPVRIVYPAKSIIFCCSVRGSNGLDLRSRIGRVGALASVLSNWYISV